MSTTRRRLLGAAAAALAGCSSVPRQPSAEAPVFSGRLLLVIEAGTDSPRRTWAAGFELHGDERSGQLLLDGPLGTRLADARWDADGVRLRTPDGERRFDDLAALSRETLGEALPLGALGRWLAGHPWPGAPALPADTGFEQLGWRVDTTALAATGVLQARRAEPAPAVSLRIVLDR